MSFDLPALPEEWQFLPLEKCAVPASISYGVVQPGTPTNTGVPIIRVNNFSDGRLDLSDVMRIAPEVESKYTRTRLSGGEVLLTLVGSVGQVAEVPLNCAGFNVARAVGVIRPANGLESKWLAICLRSPLSQQLLGSRANTTVQTTINLKDVRALPVPIPPAAERAQISGMVGTLDDRIALLRETNATLEAIAQALFKSWFVDFDPVRAKSQGLAPAGMDEATAALFPDGFEESALGPCPRGWQLGKVEDLLELAYGKALKATDRIPGQVPVYGSGGIAGHHNEALVFGPGVIVGRKGTIGTLYWEDQPFFPIDTVFYVRSKLPLTFCFHQLAVLGLREMNTDGAVPGLNRNNVYRLQVVVPPLGVVDAFDAVVTALRARVSANQVHAETLTVLRDTLLPRLISGQLRLPQAQEATAEATHAD